MDNQPKVESRSVDFHTVINVAEYQSKPYGVVWEIVRTNVKENMGFAVNGLKHAYVLFFFKTGCVPQCTAIAQNENTILHPCKLC